MILADEDNDSFPSSPPQLPIRNTVKGKRTSRRKECNKDRSYGSITSQSQQNIAADDEDYIVFCFSEDGAFDVVKDGKSEPSSNHIDCTKSSSWPVNRKINFGESEKIVNSNEGGNATTNEAEIIPVKEYEEEDIESAGSRYQSEQGMVSVESSDSNRSDNSTASFAFPVLGWEWMGSPAQMPKSEGLHLRKHKARSLTFQCCRF
ncbi:hypothetical protein LWI29_007324 [Acer saccharum]|uniref:Uncharacterized protein n=1 Tax=Acer saccharum TaxID=4024 RepID=A0AA39S9Z5_ACESA|nr:hypothetical protein LWI29_007324 [Acer saccharum]KAK1564699.1 hypothetical protein Q3G72_009497 [Acer saccharum]